MQFVLLVKLLFLLWETSSLMSRSNEQLFPSKMNYVLNWALKLMFLRWKLHTILNIWTYCGARILNPKNTKPIQKKKLASWAVFLLFLVCCSLCFLSQLCSVPLGTLKLYWFDIRNIKITTSMQHFLNLKKLLYWFIHPIWISFLKFWNSCH